MGDYFKVDLGVWESYDFKGDFLVKSLDLATVVTFFYLLY
jgi:hypothetical protein